MMNYRFIVFFLIVLFNACSDSESDTVPDLGYDYFPLRTGAERIYHVDSFAYDNNSGNTTIDTFSYYYREQTGAPFIDDMGKPAYFILRAVTDSIHHEWIPLVQWVASRDNEKAERVEDNRRFVKMIFPLSLSKNWDGNMYTNLGFERYRVVEYGTPYAPFQESVLIEHRNDSNAIELIRKSERYVRHMGLVQLLSDSINTQINGSRGYKLNYTLISAK